MRHAGGDNLSEESVVAYLKDLARRDRVWVGANIKYDLEWLWTEGVELRGQFRDIQIVEALIDEEQPSYALDVIAKKYLQKPKDETLLREAAREFGVNPKSGLHKLPARYVGQYAEVDARLPLDILECQMLEIEKQDLKQIFDLEMSLTHLLWEMRRQGVRVDLDAAASLSKKLKDQEDEIRFAIYRDHGCRIDEWSGPMLARMCDRLKIHYLRTPKGNASFEGTWLDDHPHPFLKSVAKLRELNRLRGTFVDQWIFSHQHKGRVHPEWKQLKGDDGGARTGRMAAANPNPQQVPSRADIAGEVRKLFIPDEGLKWAKYDYSQQEPRLLVHYASKTKCSGADMIRMAYKNNAEMDIYKFLAEAAGVTRRESKTITLGRCYGMGAAKLANGLGISLDAAKNLMSSFDDSVPFVKEMSDKCMLLAQNRGFIKTLCGRRRHFTLWEPVDTYYRRENGEYIIPLRADEARAKWNKTRLQRAMCHKALNALIQGSAADMTKMAMLTVRQLYGQVPYLQVHDELDYGLDPGLAQPVHKVLETCVDLIVPIKADLVLGDHWK